MDNASAERVYLPAALRAVQEFPVRADRLCLVHMAENVTFRVLDTRSGTSYVLRLHRPGYHDAAELSSEHVWLRALADAGISVPTPIQACDGREYVPVHIPQTGETRYAGLAYWIDGQIVAEVLTDGPALKRYGADLGALMASMHNQASSWSPPATFRRQWLDADGLVGPDPFWGRFWEHGALSPGERSLLTGTRDAIHAALRRHGCDPQTFSMIHADQHQDNLLMHGEELTLIDFDDAGFGWHQYDIAVALFHAEMSWTDRTDFEAAFLSSYRAVRPIGDEEMTLVPMFRLVRGMALIGWKAERPEVEWVAGRFDRLMAGVLAGCDGFETPC
jgi:Ser/Thr protein kinase RdoA (MazF antagonist)